MVLFFFDESIHDYAGFILGAWVAFSASPDELLSIRLREVGVSESLEFHSAVRMAADAETRKLRDAMRSALLPDAKIAVAIVPRQEREALGLHALHSLKQTLELNRLTNLTHHFYLDEGLLRQREGEEAVQHLKLDDAGHFYFEQD